MEIVTKVMEKSWKSHGNLLVKMCTNPEINSDRVSIWLKPRINSLIKLYFLVLLEYKLQLYYYNFIDAHEGKTLDDWSKLYLFSLLGIMSYESS